MRLTSDFGSTLVTSPILENVFAMRSLSIAWGIFLRVTSKQSGLYSVPSYPRYDQANCRIIGEYIWGKTYLFWVSLDEMRTAFPPFLEELVERTNAEASMVLRAYHCFARVKASA